MPLRRAWGVALLAAFLNLVAPVLAYAVPGPADEHAHHAGMLHHEPKAPHCPYCLDFAAGAALGGSVPVIPAAQPGHPPLPWSEPPRVSARPSLRLAPPRGPPLAA